MHLFVPLLISFLLRAHGHGYLTRAVPRTGQTGTYTFPTNRAGKSRLARDFGYAWAHHNLQGEAIARTCSDAEKNANPKTCYWRGDPTACVLGACAAPINQRLNRDLFVCRGPNKNPDLLQVPAGSSLDFRYLLAADHLGDCDVFISYDVNKPMQQKEFFKIANVPQCEKQQFKMSQADCAADDMVVNQGTGLNKCDQMFHATITLPAWLPEGEVILRFGWVAVHPFPNIEYYADCVDAYIQPGSASPIALTAITKYPLKDAFPASSCDHRGTAATNWQEQPCARGSRSKFVYRCNWQPPSGPCVPNPETWMLGPECANQYSGNDCAATARGTEGNTLEDNTDPTVPTTQAPQPSTPAPTEGPTPAPTGGPTPAPTDGPTPAPTNGPTPAPTEAPTPAPTEGPTPEPTQGPTPDPDGVPESIFCALVQNLNMGFLRRLAKKASKGGGTQWTGEEVCAAIVKYCENAKCKPAAGTLTVPAEKEELLEGLFFDIGEYTLDERGPQGSYPDPDSTSAPDSISNSMPPYIAISTSFDGGEIGAISSALQAGAFESLTLLGMIYLLL